MTADRITLKTTDERELWRLVLGSAHAVATTDPQAAAIAAILDYRERLPERTENCGCQSKILFTEQGVGTCYKCGKPWRSPVSGVADAHDDPRPPPNVVLERPTKPKGPDYPPPGWSTSESQNLHKPWTCQQVGDCTPAHATEQSAIDAAWTMATEGGPEPKPHPLDAICGDVDKVPDLVRSLLRVVYPEGASRWNGPQALELALVAGKTAITELRDEVEQLTADLADEKALNWRRRHTALSKADG